MPQNLRDNFINLNSRLDVGEIGNVSHDFCAVLREHRLNFISGLYPEVRQTHERSSRAVQLSDTLADFGLYKVRAHMSGDHGSVGLGVIIKVERAAVLLRIGY